MATTDRGPERALSAPSVRRPFLRAVLFAGGLGWLAVLTHSPAQAIRWGLQWFVFAEVIKVLVAAGIATRVHRRASVQQ